jgi:osmotically-inducible protein OsmY
MKTDAELQQAIQEEMLFEPAVRATDIGVTVKNGIAALVGTVDSYAEKWAAERAAERVAGVRALAKDLTVKLPTESRRSNEELALAVLQTLKWDVQVPDDRLSVEVEGGLVTLTGDVDSQFQREAAIRAVRNLEGVVNVLNRIQLTPQASPKEIRAEIEAALRRRGMETNGIGVEVTGGLVVLRGKVRSWAEREEVERAAWHPVGVTRVVDGLLIQE